MSTVTTREVASEHEETEQLPERVREASMAFSSDPTWQRPLARPAERALHLALPELCPLGIPALRRRAQMAPASRTPSGTPRAEAGIWAPPTLAVSRKTGSVMRAGDGGLTGILCR